MNPARLLSIGHSNHSIESFLRLLQDANVTAVADVRTQPASRRYPQFNRTELESFLGDHDITYVFLGDLLGGRPGNPSLYDADGRVNYERVRAAPFFRQGIDRLIAGSEKHRIAMLCAEEDPLDCHRGLMIARGLIERGMAPSHLRGDGSLDTSEATERRLLAITGVGSGIVDGLFAAALSDADQRQLLSGAYRAQARRKAFRLRPANAHLIDGEEIA
jgi:uncharacterized protein (DUF488 family)